MKPHLTQFESENPTVEVVKINVDEDETEKFKKYSKYLVADGIPYTVMLDSKGKVVKSFLGFHNAEALAAPLKAKAK